MKKPRLSTSFMRSRKGKYYVLLMVGVMTMLCVPCLRNTALAFVWPNAWRQLAFTDLLELLLSGPLVMGVQALESCPAITKTDVKLTDVDISKIKTYPRVNTTELHSEEHSRFLVPMTVDDKVRLLHTYLVLADALRKIGVKFFFVQGALLGVYRHQGLIPWDDDIDIVISVSDWKLVRHALSCIDGFILSVTTYMHWKFYPNSTNPRLGYPFVDMFFYRENACFLWTVDIVAFFQVVLDKKDTFPLSTASYEGISVPVPWNIEKVLRARYKSFYYCKSRYMDHKSGIYFKWSEISEIPCSSLNYLYSMYHLDQSSLVYS